MSVVAAGFLPVKDLNVMMAVPFNFKAGACSCSIGLGCTVGYSTWSWQDMNLIFGVNFCAHARRIF
jgi:hypothetical protein